MRMANILSVGLTGGIGSGKSVVSTRMAERGAVVIDADLLARQVLEPGTEGLAEVVEVFGDQVVDDHGALDRAALGNIVFADDTARARLNQIVHPRVRAEAASRREAAPEGSAVVEDIPLLVETGQQDRFDVVVVVQAPYQERIRRMIENRGMSREEAESRIKAQASDAERAAAADVVLNNAGTPEELQSQVDQLMDTLNDHAAGE